MIVMKRMGVEGGDDDVGGWAGLSCAERAEGTEKGTHEEVHGLHECDWQSTKGIPHRPGSCLRTKKPNRMFWYPDPHRCSYLPTLPHNNPSRQHPDSTMDLYPDP